MSQSGDDSEETDLAFFAKRALPASPESSTKRPQLLPLRPTKHGAQAHSLSLDLCARLRENVTCGKENESATNRDCHNTKPQARPVPTLTLRGE